MSAFRVVHGILRCNPITSKPQVGKLFWYGHQLLQFCEAVVSIQKSYQIRIKSVPEVRDIWMLQWLTASAGSPRLTPWNFFGDALMHQRSAACSDVNGLGLWRSKSGCSGLAHVLSVHCVKHCSRRTLPHQNGRPSFHHGDILNAYISFHCR